MALSSHAITSTRLKQVNFSNGIYCTGSVILTRAGGPMTAKDLTGRLVAAEVGSINLNFLKKLPNSPTVKVMTSSADALDALINRKVDAVIDGNITALQAVKSSTSIKLQVSPLLWKTQAGIAFAKSKDSNELRKAINKVYAEMLNDGTFKRLSENTLDRISAAKLLTKRNLKSSV